MKNRTTAAILAFFLGGIGVHRFYLGQMLYGFLSLLFFWTLIPSLIAFIDFIIFLTMTDAAFNQKYNNGQMAPANGSGINIADEIAKLHKLKTDGIITEEEYQRRKAQMI